MLNQLLTDESKNPVWARQLNQIGDSASDYALLVKCVRRALQFNSDTTDLALRESDVCWPRLLQLAEYHDVLPLLAAALKNEATHVPDQVRSCLEQRWKTVVAHNLSLASELIAVLTFLRESGVSAIPFKGPALAAALYGNLSLRQIADLDIFIEKDCIQPALGVLKSRGYELHDKFRTMSQEQLYRNQKDIELIHPASGIHLELHWSACEPTFDKKMSLLSVHPGRFTVDLFHQEIPLPSPEDLLLLLALHGLRHRWENLKWICDIACLFRAYPEFDWSLALEKAKRVSRERMVLLAVLLVREISDLTLPPQVVKRITEEPELSTVARQIFVGHRAALRAPEAFSREAVLDQARVDALRLRTRDSATDRVKLLCSLISDRFKPNKEDGRCSSVPAVARSSYWLVRPIRIIFSYGPACIFHLTTALIRASYRTETSSLERL